MQGEEVALDEKGDRLGRYEIYQFLEGRDYVKIGEWGNE